LDLSNEDILQPKTLSNFAVIELKNGKKRKHEFYFGSGYLSASSRTLIKDKSMSSVAIEEK
jgi:hypothetical protein